MLVQPLHTGIAAAPSAFAPAPVAQRPPLLLGGLGPIFGRAPVELTPGPPVATGSRGWKLWNQDTATSAIVDAIRGATEVVNAEFFGFVDAGKGAHVVDALVDAAKRGVEVNVIADRTSLVAPPVGGFLRLYRNITRAGGHVVMSNPGPLDFGEPRAAGRRHTDHRKVVTVDGALAFTGGMNFLALTDGYHDSVVELQGAAAGRLSADQLDRWRRVGGAITPGHSASVANALRGADLISKDPNDMRVVANAPEQSRFEISDQYVELIRAAKERLWISSPAFTDQSVLREIRAAAERGVDVRMIAPGSAVMGLAAISEMSRSNLARIIAAGGRAFEIPEVLHRKAIISDDDVILASYNITSRSRVADHEVGLRTRDPEFVGAIAKVLQGDMDRAREFDPNSRVGWMSKVTDWLRDIGFSY